MGDGSVRNGQGVAVVGRSLDGSMTFIRWMDMDGPILIHRRRLEPFKQILELLLATPAPRKILLPPSFCAIINTTVIIAVDTIVVVQSSQIPVSHHKPTVTRPCTRIRIDDSSSIVVAAVVAPVQTAFVVAIKPTIATTTTTTTLHRRH